MKLLTLSLCLMATPAIAANQSDIVAQAFDNVKAAYHVTHDCPPPRMQFNSDYIATVCQAYALPGNYALSCYDTATQTITLANSWDGNGLRDRKLLYHEMDRHIEQACLHHKFTSPEPASVLAAEDLAEGATSIPPSEE